MKKVEEYLRHAAECREMARTAIPKHREQLENMAMTWERLAEVRKLQLLKGWDSGPDENLDLER